MTQPLTDQQLDDEHQARTARLLAITTDQIKHYSFETICDWLDARRGQHLARLRAACQTLREQNDRQAHAHARIAAALAAAVPDRCSGCRYVPCRECTGPAARSVPAV